MHRAARWLLVAPLALSVLVAACGGDELTLEEYFGRVDKLDDARAAEMERLNGELRVLPPNDVSGGLDILGRQTDAREEFAEGLDDLDRPDEIAGLHDTAVTSLRRAVEEFRGYIEDNRDAQTVFDLLEGFGRVDFDAISAAIEQCEELQRYAARNGITVELNCE